MKQQYETKTSEDLNANFEKILMRHYATEFHFNKEEFFQKELKTVVILNINHNV